MPEMTYREALHMSRAKCILENPVLPMAQANLQTQ